MRSVPDRIATRIGKSAVRVWSYLTEESTRANAGPKGSLLKSRAEIVTATGLAPEDAETAIIELATAGYLSKITREGLVAA